jgi:hypothetical protein
VSGTNSTEATPFEPARARETITALCPATVPPALQPGGDAVSKHTKNATDPLGGWPDVPPRVAVSITGSPIATEDGVTSVENDGGSAITSP